MGCFSSKTQAQIIPFQVQTSNQINFFLAGPSFNLFLPGYGGSWVIENFIINQLVDMVFLSKTLDHTRLVFPDSFFQVIGHPSIKSCIALGRQNVNIIRHAHHPLTWVASPRNSRLAMTAKTTKA